MQQTSNPIQPGLRVVMHISPASYVAGILAAQRRNLSQSEFLDGAIAAACADDQDCPDRLLPWGPHAMELFLQLADTVPEAFRGKWRVLYALVVNDPTLWKVPQATLGDHEAGVDDPDWHINADALAKAWPRLVSKTFLC